MDLPLLKSQIQSLEREVQFLREELKFLKSLATAHVALVKLHSIKKNEIKSTITGSYNQITTNKYSIIC